MDTITAELPALLGYLALAVILAVGVIVTMLAQRAARNRRIRHARLGCHICWDRLAQEDADRDVDAWLDYPQAGHK